MSFENDVFISYAHIDDMALIEGQKGWIAAFHRALEIRLGQLLGRPPRIWRDPKLQGNDVFADRLVERLPTVAILVSIITPRYLKSDWCLRELREFIKAAANTGGVRIGHKARVFKVVKTPVPLEQQVAELQHMLGYEFFTADPVTGRPKELSQTGDAEIQRLYWAKLDDLAHDLTELIETLEASGAGAAALPSPEAASMTIAPTLPGTPQVSSAAQPAAARPSAEKAVYLAETTYDLREKRDAIRRELQTQGLQVLPSQPLPHVKDECEQAIREALAGSFLSIHLVGKNYGLIPEGATQSTVVMQNELAIERADSGDYPRLIWIPERQECDDERQLKFIEHLQTDTRIQQGADILQTTFEEFKAAVNRRLREEERREAEKREAEKREAERRESEKRAAAAGMAPATAAPEPSAPADGGESKLVRIYVISDRRDETAPAELADYLYDQGFEVILPVFEGEEAQIRKDHEENLSVCDAVLFYYGEGNELWLRQKLREVQKSAAFGRKKPIVIKAIYVAPPDNPSKAKFRTREAMVIDQRAPFDPAVLTSFISQLQ